MSIKKYCAIHHYYYKGDYCPYCIADKNVMAHKGNAKNGNDKYYNKNIKKITSDK